LSSETTGAELKVIAASFCDPWLLLLDESSIFCLFKMNDSGDLEETELGGDISKTKWLSGCLYKSEATRSDTLAFLLSAQGALQIYCLPDLSNAVYSSEGLSYTPSTFGPDFVVRRAASRETLTEILVADLGDATHSSPHLVARTASDDLVIYQPYHSHEHTSSDPFTKDLRWLKVPQPRLAKYSDEPLMEAETSGRQALLKGYSNIGGYKTIAQIGTSPCLVLKEASSAPRVISLQLPPLKTLSSLHTAECSQGFIFIDSEGVSRSCQLPTNCRYGDTGWVMKKIPMEQTVERVVWHQAAGVYIISVATPINFKLPEDDYHHEWANETTGFLPRRYRSTLKMVHPGTWSIIDEYDFERPEEITLDMKVMDLVTSEKTLQRKPCIVVGSGIVFGEDQLCEGHVSIFDVIDVVPEPGRPETGHKFKLITSLKTKGAVTAVSEAGTEGFVVEMQGQKCYVRGLKDDNSFMPVAFLDMQSYVSFVKNITGTGLLLMGDALKGLWLTAYTVSHEIVAPIPTHSRLTGKQEEPSYRMVPLSKGPLTMETLAGDFLPWEKNLYIVTADGDSNLHVFHYDPENLQSLSGTRLIHKSSFHTGHFPISLTRVPSTLSPSEEAEDSTNGDAMQVDGSTPAKPPDQVLYTSKSGVLALVTPIDENMYRRLSMIQVYLHNQLDHHCSLNPRGYRAVADEGLASRGVLDGTLLRRWNELSSLRKAEACAKAGVEAWVVRSDLEFIGGGGLAYL
jgi:cleavage and polyadenylation specificity factor subunit 1